MSKARLVPIDYVKPTGADTNGWKARHKAAVLWGLTAGPAHSHPVAIVQGIAAWISYAGAHQDRFGSKIGEDYVLGPAWAAWGKALLALLNGETGNLDCGTLDHIIRANLDAVGLEAE